MTEETNTEATEEAETEAPKLDIVRGRMPLVLVYLIKFNKTLSDSDLASKFRTTNGKVSDIKKDRNFGYVHKDDVFTQEDLDAAKEHVNEKFGPMAEAVVEMIDGLKPGTKEEAEKVVERRKSERKPRGKTAEPKVDDSKEKAEEAAEEEEAEDDLDALLAE